MSDLLDEQTDPQIAAIADLLFGAIRAKFGDEAATHVYRWPIRPELVPTLQVPALVVYREADRTEPASDTVEDVRTITLHFDYYAPIAPLDRVEARWPLLHRVWTFALACLRIGWFPGVLDENNVVGDGDLTKILRLAAVGFDVPASVVGLVRYQTAQSDSGLIPMFAGTVTIRASGEFDVSDYPTDDLESVVADVYVDGDEHAHAFTSIVDELDE